MRPLVMTRLMCNFERNQSVNMTDGCNKDDYDMDKVSAFAHMIQKGDRAKNILKNIFGSFAPCTYNMSKDFHLIHIEISR